MVTHENIFPPTPSATPTATMPPRHVASSFPQDMLPRTGNASTQAEWPLPTSLQHTGSMPIAVVGMSFRGPADATSIENLWKMVYEKREGWSSIPKERWNNYAFYHPDNSRHGTVRKEQRQDEQGLTRIFVDQCDRRPLPFRRFGTFRCAIFQHDCQRSCSELAYNCLQLWLTDLRP